MLTSKRSRLFVHGFCLTLLVGLCVLEWTYLDQRCGYQAESFGRNKPPVLEYWEVWDVSDSVAGGVMVTLVISYLGWIRGSRVSRYVLIVLGGLCVVIFGLLLVMAL